MIMSENPEKRKHVTCDEVLELERQNQAELKETIKHIELENSILKSECEHMKFKLKCCNRICERNIEIFQEMVDSTRGALQSSRGLDFSVVSKQSNPDSNNSNNNNWSSSEKPILRENNLQYVRQKTAAERKLLKASSSAINLTIIPEESSQSLSEVYVQLTPLPKPVIDRFLQKISVGNIENEAVSSPQFTSTPTIYQLGLSATGDAADSGVDSRFVNKRVKRRQTDPEDDVEAGGRLSLQISVQARSSKQRSGGESVTVRRRRIKIEPDGRQSCSSSSGSEISSTTNEILVRTSNENEINNGRPGRELRRKTTKSFKEPPLNKKMRRT